MYNKRAEGSISIFLVEPLDEDGASQSVCLSIVVYSSFSLLTIERLTRRESAVNKYRLFLMISI